MQQDASRASNEEEFGREGGKAYFAEEVDARLQCFTTAMKTPGGAGSSQLAHIPQEAANG